MRDILLKYSSKPFRYGDDCCAFVGDCLKQMTGKNPAEGLRYKTKAEADAIIEKHGSLEAAISFYLGSPYDGIKDGDVCLLPTNDGDVAAGIVFNGRIVARVARGLMDYPLDRAIKVWCV